MWWLWSQADLPDTSFDVTAFLQAVLDESYAWILPAIGFTAVFCVVRWGMRWMMGIDR